MDYVWWFSSLCAFLGFEMCALKEGRRKEEKWEGGNEEWTPAKELRSHHVLSQVPIQILEIIRKEDAESEPLT